MRTYITILCIFILSCSASTRKKAPVDSLIVGKWRLVGKKCDASGNNCTKPRRWVQIEFTRDGYIIPNNVRWLRRIFTLSNNIFRIEDDLYPVRIIKLSKTTLITHEKFGIARFTRVGIKKPKKKKKEDKKKK